MGFKDFLAKMKDGAAAFAKTTARINDGGYYGTVDHGKRDGDFAPGGYLNIEDGKGLIHSQYLQDYWFTAEDIVAFKVGEGNPITTKRGGQEVTAQTCAIGFKDGKVACATILTSKLDKFVKDFMLDEFVKNSKL